MRRVCLLLVPILAGCPAAEPGSPAKGDPVNAAEQQSEPRTAAERLVRDYILDNADDPKSVAFASWGPHSLEGEFAGASYVRARFRATNKHGATELFDRVYLLRDGKVAGAWANPFGENYLAQERQTQKMLAPRQPVRQ
jgi:hypothetical protein